MEKAIKDMSTTELKDEFVKITHQLEKLTSSIKKETDYKVYACAICGVLDGDELKGVELVIGDSITIGKCAGSGEALNTIMKCVNTGLVKKIIKGDEEE